MANQIDNDAKVIADSNWGFGGHKIVRNSSGHIYAVQVNDLGYLELHKSEDNGDNWSLITTFNDASTIFHPCIDVDGNDNIYVTYCYGSSSPYTMKLKKVTSVDVVTTPITETIYFETKRPSSYVRASSNIIHLVWIENTDGLSAESSIIKSKKSIDYGVNFSDNINYTFPGSPDVIYYQPILGLDLDSSGNICVATWIPNYYILWKFQSDGTYISNTSMAGSGSASDARGMDFLINNNDEHWNVFLTYLFGYFRLTTHNGGGHTNLENYLVNIKPGHISIGCDGNDNIYVFFTETDEKLYMRKYDSDSDTWGAKVAMTTGDGMRPSCELHVPSAETWIHYVYFSD